MSLATPTDADDAMATAPENPWLPFCGILKDDPLFNEWADRFWEEKQAIDDDEELSVEELLGKL